ncbi:MAG TPA: hypothetical protein DCZ01_03000 [Elusimicrobia bacterium]|nr:MAG: hypothetical protein A2X37_05630 [Elusimicrobia bacterium GWA2_66_18]OGR75689.1 MAG: hypothetical protein A2X40_00615 [Elusimicrobia bacterium GWC2_65_9]HAZ07498.1 hypothetical protein [Elusimicrobiota bacterium]
MASRRKLLSAFLALASVLTGAPVFSQIRGRAPGPVALQGRLGVAAGSPAAPTVSFLTVLPETAILPVTVTVAVSEGPSSAASEEKAKVAADAFFDAAKPAAPGEDGAVAAGEPASVAVLHPAGPYAAARAAASIYDPDHIAPSRRDRLRDRLRYGRITARSFFWYMYTHIKDMWPGYIGRWKQARAEGPVAVSSPRSFFTAMRVTGMSGRFYALGGSALEDGLVIREFRGAFARYFDGPGVGARERAALERFMTRAQGFNAEKRAHTNMYKNIRDPLLKASTMRPDRLADFFDGLLPPHRERTVLDFQRSGRMDEVREAFMSVLMRTLNEENPRAPDRVRAAIVLGSFATGSAGPSSDFDVEALVDGAGNNRLAEFSRRLVAHWTAAGHHSSHPVTVHTEASWPSWGLVNIVQTRHYIVVSPEPALIARLSRRAFEDPAVRLERGYTPRGDVNRVIQRAIVAAGTAAADLRALFGMKPSSSGH